jgi:hypothetical protein
MVPSKIPGQDMEKPKVITDCNSKMGEVDLNNAYLTNYRSTSKRLIKYYQKPFCSFNDTLVEFILILEKKKGSSISTKIEFK